MAAKAKTPAKRTKARGAGPASRKLEPVLAFRATGSQLVFRVFTGGCTEAGHFDLGISRRNGKAEVTLNRRVPDTCKGDFPEGEEITYSYAEIGLERGDVVRLRNPVRRGPSGGTIR